MAFDLILLGIALVFLIHGLLSGILRTVLLICSIALAYLASRTLGSLFGVFISKQLAWPHSISYGIGRLIAGLIIMVSLLVAALQANRLWGMSRYGIMKRWNSLLGGAGGLIIGLSVSFVLACVLELYDQAFGDSAPKWIHGNAQSSYSVRLASRFNPAPSQAVTDVVLLVDTARKNPGLFAELQKDPAFADLMNIPSVRAVRDDREIDKLIENHDWLALLRHPKIKQMADDPKVMDAVFKTSIFTVLKHRINEIKTVDLVGLLLRARGDEELSHALAHEEKARYILEGKSFIELSKDEPLCRAIEEKDYEVALQSALLNDIAADRRTIEAASDQQLLHKIEALTKKYQTAALVRLLLLARKDRRLSRALESDMRAQSILKSKAFFELWKNEKLCKEIEEKNYGPAFQSPLFEAVLAESRIVETAADREYVRKLAELIEKPRESAK